MNVEWSVKNSCIQRYLRCGSFSHTQRLYWKQPKCNSTHEQSTRIEPICYKCRSSVVSIRLWLELNRPEIVLPTCSDPVYTKEHHHAIWPVILCSKLNQLFLGYFDATMIISLTKINNFQGDVTDVSALTKSHDMISSCSCMHCDQCLFCSRNIAQVTPKIIYFHYLIKFFPDQSIQKNIFNFEKRSTDCDASLSHCCENHQYFSTVFFSACQRGAAYRCAMFVVAYGSRVQITDRKSVV